MRATSEKLHNRLHRRALASRLAGEVRVEGLNMTDQGRGKQ